MKNILVLHGSPKKNGNTASLVEWFSEGARAQGGRVEVVEVASLESRINGCLSCRRCQQSAEYGCVVDDGVNRTLKKMAGADVIVFATPLYFYGPSAQLKLVIDRMFSLYKWDNTVNTFESPLKGKMMCLLLSAYEDIGLDIVEKSFQLIAEYSEMGFLSLLAANAGESTGIGKVPGMPERARDLGRKCAGL